MLPNVQQVCDSLTVNYAILNRLEPFTAAEIPLAAAAICTARGRMAEKAAIDRCREIIRSRTGVVSEYRGTARFITYCKMALSGDPEAYFARVDSIYRILNPGFFGNESNILAAMILADAADSDVKGAAYAEQTLKLYQKMKSTHLFLTDVYDRPFAAVMAISGKDADALTDEAEACFRVMKAQKLGESNALQSLSHVLALYAGRAEEKCERVRAIRDGLKKEKHPYPGSGRLAMLGLFSDVSMPAEDIVQEIVSAEHYLQQQKVFQGLFSAPGTEALRMYAAQSVQSALAGQQTAVCSAEVSAMLSAAVTEAIAIWMMLMAASVTT